MKHTILPVLTALLFALAALAMSGCETTKGLGRDIETLGEGLQDAAD